MTDRTTPAFAARLDRLIGVQRLAMVWEDLWPAVQRPAMTVGIAVMVVASGVLQNMNAPGRIAALAGLALLFAISLRGLFGVALPSRLAAMRRMESAAGVAHRGVSSLADAPAPELDRPETKPLWTEHKRRQFATLGHIPVSPPRSAWRKFDPAAVRVPVALGGLVALILGTGDFATNLRDATRLTPTTVAVPLTLDAWLKPPAYTAKPPLLLSGDAMHEKVLGGQDILVPENSVFTARLTGAVLPTLKFLSVETASEDETTAPQEIAGISQAVSVADGVLTAEAKLTRPAMIVVADGDRELARYRLVLIPDQPPEIQLTKSPHGEARGALAIDWWAKDDYGVKALSGELTLADEQDGGIGFDSNGIFLFDPPELKLALRHPNAKDEKGTSTNDLAAHPWAGLRVVMTLKVKDAAGQEQSSPEAIFVLPQREFIRPLAQALIEQRKQLIHYPEKAAEAGALLDALLAYPAGLVDRSGHIIAIASLSSRLRNASGYDDVKLAISGLWDVAVAIEEGSLADARAELQALRKELEKALQDGAPPERIAELMDRMRQAMDRFLEAMREETERRQRDGMAQKNTGRPGKSVSKDDLQKMLDALEDLAKGGSRDLAQQLLAELDRLLQNLQPGNSGQPGDEGDQQLSDMLDQLGQMMQRQQGLMDETQRLPGDGGDQSGPGGDGNGGTGSGRLADRQGALQEMLDQLMRGAQGAAPGELGDASRSMEGAEQSLRGGDREGALRQQGEALEQMRKGAGRMAEQLRENGQGQSESQARDGEGRDGGDDPLGRPRATRNPGTGPDKDMVPSELAIRRAREILETLRAKANGQGLTDGERNYIDRLLRGLY